ncbi:MAG TPA: hypothetical protein VF590_23890 [Isosphaeraceae bacterium]|jgi:archaellum biogenesis protein FlaJ (TadC family)
MVGLSVLSLLSLVVSLGLLVCFILVVVQAFQHGNTGAGVGLILSLFLCGLGILVGLIYGWVKADQWRIRNLMLTYTGLFVANIALTAATLPATLRAMQQQAVLQQNQGVPMPMPMPTPIPMPVPPAPAPAPAP